MKIGMEMCGFLTTRSTLANIASPDLGAAGAMEAGVRSERTNMGMENWADVDSMVWFV